MEKSKKICRLNLNSVKEYGFVIIVMGLFSIICNFVGYGNLITESLPGMLILMSIAFCGVTINKLIPWKVPSIIYISLLAILVSNPLCPFSDAVIKYTSKVNSVCLVTPLLAFVGMELGKDRMIFIKSGWKAIIVTLLLIFGTLLCSAAIAQLVLYLQGVV